MIEDDAFWDNFGKAIEEKYPGIKEFLRDRIKDLENHDCEIVIAGNVFEYTLIRKKTKNCSQGKTVAVYTLINTLLILIQWLMFCKRINYPYINL